jgi:hypothetical protein
VPSLASAVSTLIHQYNLRSYFVAFKWGSENQEWRVVAQEGRSDSGLKEVSRDGDVLFSESVIESWSRRMLLVPPCPVSC